MNCYTQYTYLSIPLVSFVPYTLKLVHTTPNIQTNLNTIKLCYSNIKMECSLPTLMPSRRALLHYCEVSGRLREGDSGWQANLKEPF